MAWKRFLVVFFRRKSAVLGAIIVLSILSLALAAPWVAPFDPIDQDLSRAMQPPRDKNLLGTDQFGRDLLSRIIWGSRISLQVAGGAMIIGWGLGSLVGLVAGYFGGVTENLLMRLLDMMMAFPTLLLAILIVATFGGGLSGLVLAIGVATIPQFGRIVRGEVLRIKSLDYVEAARALGGSHLRIMYRHLLPNVWSTIIVLVTLRVSVAILSEASLSFLGLGIRPPAPSWGTMIAEGNKFLIIAPWMSIVPGLAIVITVLAFNLFGDGLRDALDPRLRGENA